MNDFRSQVRKKSKQRWFVTGIMVAIMAVVLILALFLFRDVETPTVRNVHFDPQYCIRMADVSRVYRIKKQADNPDILWFGTAEGIRVLNTETMGWTRYGLDHGLHSETISDIAFSENVPWVATWSGIAWFDTAKTTFIGLPGNTGLANARILAIESYPDQGVFFTVDGGGLFRIAGPDSLPKPFNIPGVPRTDRITCLRVIDSTMYVGVEGKRLFRHTPGNSEFEQIPFTRSSPKTYIWDVLKRHDGLWVATSDDGVWRLALDADTLQPIPKFPAKGAYIFVEEEGGLWCGTPFGLWRYHDEGQIWIQFVHPEERKPTDFQVFALENAGDDLWYGSMDLGAGYIGKKQVEWHPMRAGLSNANVAVIAADDTIFWTGYGYQGGYIDRFDIQDVQYDRNFNYNDGITDPNIQSFLLEGQKIYFGGYTSFGYIDLAKGLRKQFSAGKKLPFGDIAHILQGDDDTLFLASLFGVVPYHPEADTFPVIPATGNVRVTCLYDLGDSLWYGTLARGLYVLDRKSGKLSSPLIQSSGRIMAILPIHEKNGTTNLFVVTKYGGCFKVNTKQVTAELVAFPENILFDHADYSNHFMTAGSVDSTIWLGTRDRGCIIYNPYAESWHTFTYYDGLISDMVRAIEDSREYIWIGCDGGVNRLDKEYIYTMWSKQS